MMAFTHSLATTTPKPATGLGKFQRKWFIMAIAKQSAIRLAKQLRLAKPFGLAKQEGMPVVVGAIDDDRPQPPVSENL